MASRDDYKWLADQERFYGDTGATAVLDEIDRLRVELERWKERAEDYRQQYWDLRMRKGR